MENLTWLREKSEFQQKDHAQAGQRRWNLVVRVTMAYLIKPRGGKRQALEFCKELPVSGEFDIETSRGARVTRNP